MTNISFETRGWFFTVLFGLAMAACSSGEPKQEFDPNCASCRKDGETCVFSSNCAAGFICNVMEDELFNAEKTTGVCLKVVCSSDSECEGGKKCTLEKICNAPVCQRDAECTGGTVCLAGTCATPPNAGEVATCEIVTKGGTILEDATLPLVALAKNANGKTLPGIDFTWMSSNNAVVAIDGTNAKGGTTLGRATITAQVTGKTSVTCTGLQLTNFPEVPQGQARVVAIEDDTGLPIANATVTFFVGGQAQEETTDTNGAATIQAATVQSVTVVRAGYQYVSVLSPGTNDLLIPVPKVPNETVAGGFRGSVDISSTRRADIQLGIAGPALPANLLDFNLRSLLGDAVKTRIDAPEFQLNDEDVNLPGGIMIALGSKKFTSDGGGLRCQGDAPPSGHLGCFVARAPAGKGAAWALAGQLKLSQVTPIANELSAALGGMGNEDLPIGDLLTAVLPLLRTMNHAINPSLEITEYPKVDAESGMTAGCENPAIEGYDEKCRGDFGRYAKIDLAATQKLNLLSRVTVPNLPMLPANGGCAGGAVLVTAAILPGRGVLPLGLSAGLDVLERGSADCKIDGVEKPFGPNSPDLSNGQMPLSMAAPHSGIEGSRLAMLVVAIDPDSVTTAALQLNAVVRHVESIGDEQDISSLSYLPYPAGTLRTGDASFAFTSALSSATAVRIEVQRGNETWLVYAPSNTATVDFPNLGTPRGVLQTPDESYVQAVRISGGTYADLWRLGSAKSLNTLVENIDAFVVQQCAAADSPCVVQ